MNAANFQNSLLMAVGLLLCAPANAADPNTVSRTSFMNSDLAVSILMSEGKQVVVASYESGDGILHGLSANPDGKRIKDYKVISQDDSKKLIDLFLDNDNFIQLIKIPVSDKINRNWHQGVEITNGRGYVRVYFTQDGEYCMAFTSSGETSSTWKCSPKLLSHAKIILGTLTENTQNQPRKNKLNSSGKSETRN